MNWNIKTFNELTTTELYHLLHLRSEIFVVEQRCVYQDIDYADQQAYHLMGTDEAGNLLAYTRIFAPGIKYAEASIGRVITSPKARGKGVGRELMECSIAQLERLFGKVPIKISAQQYLQRFYVSLGFQPVSDMYLEDGIPHIDMIK
ncbi:GNAT family N-acetyltransferase [Chitinophaga sp. 30R24]|uniref:GNAT family N-acetyltransferase n=1 Tax=Chitinophaga sp. 30R24 TaxID=3248838 RepID=UPI003B8EF2FA